MQVLLLVALGIAFIGTLMLCGLALKIAPSFRSGERKDGMISANQSLSNSDIKTQKSRNGELPLVGSWGIVPATILASAATAWLIGFNTEQWILLGILAFGYVGYWFVGLIDDWKKVYKGEGIRESTKMVGILIISAFVGIAIIKFVDVSHSPYPPYTDIPVIGTLIRHENYVWPIFFVLLLTFISTVTSLAVDFSDGLDGLAGGLMFPAAIAYAIITMTNNQKEFFPVAIASLALAGSVLGYLPWNWPSAWRSRSAIPRKARVIMGDSGSLAIGGLLALIAVIDRQELLLIFIGGIFVLEGLSAVVQTRILVKIFRRFLTLMRFADQDVWVQHTEFPLPFLATPMHHHFDILGWDRRRIVYSAWFFAAIMATLGVASVFAPFTWERYFTRGLTVILMIFLWQTGSSTRKYFVGTVQIPGGQRRLALFYGFPYRFMRQALFARVETVEATISVVSSPAERALLWQRTNVFDARATLGYFCYRAGYYALAREQWERIPQRNLDMRPEIRELLTEARRRLTAGVNVNNNTSSGTLETAVGAEPSPAETIPGKHLDVNSTGPLVKGVVQEAAQTLPNDSSWVNNKKGEQTY